MLTLDEVVISNTTECKLHDTSVPSSISPEAQNTIEECATTQVPGTTVPVGATGKKAAKECRELMSEIKNLTFSVEDTAVLLKLREGLVRYHAIMKAAAPVDAGLLLEPGQPKAKRQKRSAKERYRCHIPIPPSRKHRYSGRVGAKAMKMKAYYRVKVPGLATEPITSPTPDTYSCETATCSSPAADASPPPQRETCSSPAADASPPPQRETCSSPGADASPPPQQETCSSPAADASPPPQDETCSSPAADASPAPQRDTCSSPAADASPPSQQETCSSPAADASPSQHATSRSHHTPLFPDVPVWGGKIRVNGKTQCMTNTCPIDNWLVIMHAILQSSPEVSAKVSGMSSKDNGANLVFTLCELYKEGRFNEAKWMLGKVNNLVPNGNTVNFYGNEHTLFVKHLEFLYRYTTKSVCSSEFCPEKTSVRLAKSTPTINNMQPGADVQDIISQELKGWLYDESYTQCLKKFPGKAPPNADVFYMQDSTSRCV